MQTAIFNSGKLTQKKAKYGEMHGYEKKINLNSFF